MEPWTIDAGPIASDIRGVLKLLDRSKRLADDGIDGDELIITLMKTPGRAVCRMYSTPSDAERHAHGLHAHKIMRSGSGSGSGSGSAIDDGISTRCSGVGTAVSQQKS